MRFQKYFLSGGSNCFISRKIFQSSLQNSWNKMLRSNFDTKDSNDFPSHSDKTWCIFGKHPHFAKSVLSDRKMHQSTPLSHLQIQFHLFHCCTCYFFSLFIKWTLFIWFQKCFPNSIFRKYKKKGSRLVEAGKAPVKSMGLSWGTIPLWVFTEAFYILQRCWIMQRNQETSLCLQFAKVIDILAVTSHLWLMYSYSIA